LDSSNNRPQTGRKKNLPWADKPLGQFPKQLLFISFDAIDSTKLKTDLQNDGKPNVIWAKPLVAFLAEATVIFQSKFSEKADRCHKKQCGDTCSKASLPKYPNITVWKYIGDEVILTAELKCVHQPHMLVHAARDTVGELNKLFKSDGYKPTPDKALEFKSTMWVAGFPSANIELDLPGPDNRPLKDYFGPSIDLGFRLAQHSTRSRIVLSASLVYLLYRYNSEAEPAAKIYGGGNLHIKGVKKGAHPLFWVIPEGVSDNTDDELFFSPSYDQELGPFFKRFYKNDDSRPFILAANDFPDSYIDAYKEVVKEQKKIPNSIFSTGKAAKSVKIFKQAVSEQEMQAVINQVPPK